MKLEAKDRKNPSLICVATVSDINSTGKLYIHFDGWSTNYDYWCDPSSADIHPMGWCETHDKDLQAPYGMYYIKKDIPTTHPIWEEIIPIIMCTVEHNFYCGVVCYRNGCSL